MSKSDILRIPDYHEHIAVAIGRIHRYVDDMAEVVFLDDEKTQDAVSEILKLSAKHHTI